MEDDGYIPAAVIDLAPKGDLLLVVGAEKMKIRVHSVILKCASRPFDAMLGPNFREGTQLALANETEPVELELPGDHGMAMMYLCSSLHFQNKDLPEYLVPERLLEVALAVDKYDLFEAMGLQLEKWCESTLCAKDTLALTQLGVLVAAARFLRHKEMFQEVMRDLVMKWNKPYTEIFTPELEELVTREVIYGLESTRSYCKLRLGEITAWVFESERRLQQSGTNMGHHSSEMLRLFCYEWNTYLCDEGLNSLKGLSVEDIMEKVGEMMSEGPHGHVGECLAIESDDGDDLCNLSKYNREVEAIAHTRKQVRRDRIARLKSELLERIEALYPGGNWTSQHDGSDEET